MNKLVVAWGGALAVSMGVLHTGFTASPSSRGAIIDVSTVAQLQSAVANLTSGTTIRIAPGRYALTQELWVRNGVSNVALVGATGDRDDVVIVGTGMNTPGVNIALKISNAQDVRIADRRSARRTGTRFSCREKPAPSASTFRTCGSSTPGSSS
jgi:hypothetical protein